MLTVEEILKRDIIKLDLGGGRHPAEGYINVNKEAYPEVDLQANITRLPFPPGSIHGIISRDTLNCFKQTETKGILRHWYRILKNGSKIIIQVPDLDQILDAYQRRCCECWDKESRLGKEDCPKCQGKPILSFERLKLYLFGKNDSPYQNCFTSDYLKELVESAGFEIKGIEKLPLRLRIIAVKKVKKKSD